MIVLSFLCPRHHSQHNHFARTKKSGVPSIFLNLLKARLIAAHGKKEHTSSQISEEARPRALIEIWKRRVKWRLTISPIHFTRPSTQLQSVKLVVFFRSQIHSYAYHLVSVCRHNQHARSPIQGFFRCEGISFIPRANKDQHSYSFRPKNTRIISFPTAPRQSPRPAQTGDVRGVIMTQTPA